MKSLHISHSSNALRDYLEGVNIFPPIGKLDKVSNTINPLKATTKESAYNNILRNLNSESKKLIKVHGFNLHVFLIESDSDYNVSGVSFWCYSIGRE